jgi:hypothetical protein
MRLSRGAGALSEVWWWLRPKLAFAALGVVLLLGAPALAASRDEAPPVPRPRPVRSVQPLPPPAATDSDTNEDTSAGDDNGPLVPPADLSKFGTTPQPVTLSAEAAEKGTPISNGLVWRIYDTKPDQNGQLAMVARSEQASPTLRLKPGDYVVHVAYGRAQASDTLSIRSGASHKQMILDAGGLKLNAMITGNVPIPDKLLRFDVFTTGNGDSDRLPVAENVAPGDILTLNAGTYHIVSHFGDVNAVVRADLRVEPGQLTEATLFHKAAEVSFKLVSEAGGEAIADIDWKVDTKDGETVFTNTGTFPTTVLAEGDYTVLAKRGDKVYNRAFQVAPGKPEDIEVLTSVY